MARISPEALRHAKRLRAGAKKKGTHRDYVDDELGDVFSDLLGGLPIIGGMFGGGKGGGGGLPGGLPDPMSLLGGLFGGGGGGGAPGAAAAAGGAMGPAPGMMGMPMPTPGPTLEQIRSVVQDALSGNRDIVERMQLQSAGGDARLAKATDAVTSAITPQLQAARGGTQAMRLQTQATSEHRGLTAAADRERLGTTRHADLVARLDRIAAAANNVQARLAGVVNPRTRAILNVR